MESKYQRARVRAENERATNYPQQDNIVGAAEDDNQGSRFRIQIHENNNNRDNEQYTFTISIQSASNDDDGAAMPPHTPTNNTNNAESNTYNNNYNTYSPTTGGEQRGPVCEGIHLPDEQEHIGWFFMNRAFCMPHIFISTFYWNHTCSYGILLKS